MGERGPHGDHGQTGDPGQTGQTGPPGVAGMRGEQGIQGPAGTPTSLELLTVRRSDRRLLILYLVGVAVLVWVSVSQVRSEADRQHFEQSITRNCLDNRTNTVNFNKFIDTLEKTYQASPVLTQRQINQRIAFFEEAKGKVPTCPPESSR